MGGEGLAAGREAGRFWLATRATGQRGRQIEEGGRDFWEEGELETRESEMTVESRRGGRGNLRCVDCALSCDPAEASAAGTLYCISESQSRD